MNELTKIKDELKDTIQETLREMVEGTEEDLTQFAQQITDGMILAIALNRNDLLEIYQGSFEMLAEKQRIRLVKSSWNAVFAVVHKIINLAVTALAA